MERKEILMVFMVFFHLCVLALSSSPLHHQETSLPSDFVQDKISRGEKTQEKSNYGFHGSGNSKRTVKHSSKLEHRIERGTTNAGTRPNPGEGGSNGSPNTPSTQGGTAFIPVYAAGAASNRHPKHHGAANCNRIGVSTVIATTMTSLLHLNAVFKWI